MNCHIWLSFAPSSVTKWFQVMGIPRWRGHCLTVIYSNIVPLNTTLFAKYLRRHPSKHICTKKLPEKLSRCLPRAIKHQLTCPIELTSGSFLIGRRGILVIPRNRLVAYGFQEAINYVWIIFVDENFVSDELNLGMEIWPDACFTGCLKQCKS